MAIKLTDIVDVMKLKWTYGDKAFGYKEEFNDNHDTQYPSLLITPPTSVFPEVTKMNGWENYTFEIYFSDLYNRTAQANETLEQRWENLQDLATEWLDMFLKNYQGSAPIQAFLDEESVVLERTKEAFNDQLVQIKMTFTWRVMSKCFIPVSTYPNQIADLSLWLRADSHVTFNIPTKKVTAWGDGSGNGNDFEGVTWTAPPSTTNSPKRYSYGGGVLNKTRLELKSETVTAVSEGVMQSVGMSPISSTEFTIFQVCQPESGFNSQEAPFGYQPNPGTLPFIYSILDGATGTYRAQIYGAGTGANLADASITATVSEVQNNVILTTMLDTTANAPNGTCLVGINNLPEVSAVSTLAWPSPLWNLGKMYIGSRTGDYVAPLNGNYQEFIVYNRALKSGERAKVKDYLNKKYKIY